VSPLPSWPSPLLPHVHTVPSDRRPTLKWLPREERLTKSGAKLAGRERKLTRPSPCSALPQLRKLSPPVAANEWSSPAPTKRAGTPPRSTVNGRLRGACAPSPSWYDEFCPHVYKVPAWSIASECSDPTAKVATPESCITWRGAAIGEKLPWPRAPVSLAPQENRLPSSNSAIEWPRPPARRVASASFIEATCRVTVLLVTPPSELLTTTSYWRPSSARVGLEIVRVALSPPCDAGTMDRLPLRVIHH
jgi:hypothetical protein